MFKNRFYVWFTNIQLFNLLVKVYFNANSFLSDRELGKEVRTIKVELTSFKFTTEWNLTFVFYYQHSI